MNNISHVAYTDESHWNKGRFRSIAMFSYPIIIHETIVNKMHLAIQESSVSEFKWEKLTDAKYRFCAERMLNTTLQLVKEHPIRIDVLIWDTFDSRHDVFDRDDEANLARMYYHLCKNVIKRRWPDAKWIFHPDKQTCVNWDTIRDTLSYSKYDHEYSDLFSGNTFRMIFKQKYNVDEIKECDSKNTPCIQFADLYAGMAVFSHENYDKYSSWNSDQAGEVKLFEDNVIQLSRSQRERSFILNIFYKLFTNCKMEIRLNSSRGLKTYDPKCPINFWLYQTQYKDDKAPTKINDYK